jgi:hypothetical protein
LSFLQIDASGGLEDCAVSGDGQAVVATELLHGVLLSAKSAMARALSPFT